MKTLDNYFADKKRGLTDVIKAIEDAKTDDDIKGISILNNQSSLGMAQSKALRDELKVLKIRKFVMAYANSYTQKNTTSIPLLVPFI
jgi:protease-4